MRYSILLSFLALGACHMADARNDESAASGPATSRSYETGSFQSVSLAGHHNVIVTVGPAASVRAEGPAEELDRIDIRVERGALRIGQKRDSMWNGGGKRPVTVYVTTPSLAGASIGGSGDMRIDRVEGGRFDGSIGGSGDMEIGSLRVDSASLSIAGSGGIRAKGTANRANISIAGSGDVDAPDLESNAATVSVLGSGDVTLRALASANVSIMGSGDVTVTGSAKCTVSKMGSGDLHCRA